MSQSGPTRDAFSAQLKEVIQKVERDLKEGDVFFEQLGLDREKARAYLDSTMTSEMRMQAQAAFEEDMRAVEQEALEQKAHGLRYSAEARTTPRRPRTLI